jgi:hypothetical protein
LEIVAYDISSIADTVSKSQGGTFDNDITVNGDLNPYGGVSGTSNVSVGDSALSGNTGSNNTAVGYRAGYSNTTGTISAFGRLAGYANTIGAGNTFIGQTSAADNSTGSYNTSLGHQALRFNTTANNTTAVGYQALYSQTTGGSENTALGYRAGYNNTGQTLLAVGSGAAYNNTTGADNTAVGDYRPLYSNTTGSYNVAIGRQALQANTTASYNTAVGYQAGYSISTGSYSTFIGRNAGTNTTGGENTFVGSSAGNLVTTGQKNTILGKFDGNAGGLDIRTQSNNIVLSDGDGNPRLRCNGSGSWETITGANGALWWAESTNSSYNSVGIHARVNRTSSGIYYFFSAYDTAASAYRFVVDDSGNVRNVNNSYGAISDQRLKENISDASSQWDDIKSIQVRKYSLIEEGSDSATQIGVIAQELEASGMSGLVEDVVDRDDNNTALDTTTKQVKYSVLYMKAVKALQEAMERIEQLEARLDAANL